MKHHKGSMTKSKPIPPISGELGKTRHEDAEYWQSRAERTRDRARRYKQPAVRDHFAKIAAGYDELARQARETKGAEAPLEEPDQDEVAQLPHEYGSISGYQLVRDALEDDEVRESLRANRRRSA